MSGRNATAFSSRRFPIKHQGQTTSEKTSIASGEVVMVGSCIGANLCATGTGRNRAVLGNACDQRLDAVPGLENRERDHGIKTNVLLIDAREGSAQRMSDAAHQRVRIAQAGVGKASRIEPSSAR